ncbi:MAG: serine protease [Coriobacteriia bacterium]|nr:serine protease [Coriobacteriia bacterium]
MFAEAIDVASGFTFPYVGLRRRADGSVFTVVASFVVINSDGWVVTSAHIVEEMLAAMRSAEQAAADPGRPLSAELVTERTEIWALNPAANSQLVGGRVNRAADLAIGRLEPFDPAWLPVAPVLRDTDTAPLRQGESVCRLGFPFHTVEAAWDGDENRFALAKNAFPAPRFALDGIISRFNRRTSVDGAEVTFVETSSPGLKGQSGGPLLDTAGRIIGIQSQTAHLDLGFDARYPASDGQPVIERQFLNVGLATHVSDLRGILDVEGAAYTLG